MKNKSANGAFVTHILFATIVLTNFLVTKSVNGQTYYSRFADAADSSGVRNTAGCSPDIQNPLAFADKDRNNVSYFKATTSTRYNCSKKYNFYTYLNLPSSVNSIDAGTQAGFMISVPTSISQDSLGKYLTINTYSQTGADVHFVESTNTLKLYALDEGQDNIDWFVFFINTKPFNVIELAVNPKIIQLNTDFEFDVAYALAQKSMVLPIGIFNFKADVTGSNVNLSWQSTSEINSGKFTIERSNNGINYASITTLNAKISAGSGAYYNYTDKGLPDGNYTYRIVSSDKDGTTKTSYAVKAVISQQKPVLYPTLLKAGEKINIQVTSNNITLIKIYDMQGRLVKQLRADAPGKYSILTNGLSAGLYNVQALANGATLTYKIVIN